MLGVGEREFYATVARKLQGVSRIQGQAPLIMRGKEDDGRWWVFAAVGTGEKVRLIEHRRFKEFRIDGVDTVLHDLDAVIAAALLL